MVAVVCLALAERLVPGLVYRDLSVGDFVLNMFYLHDIVGADAVLAVAWTLCLEVQFYLVVVLLVLASGRMTRRMPAQRRFLLAAALALGAVSHPDPWGGQWFAYATAVVIAGLVALRRIAAPVPAVLLYFGSISYSLYLVNLPVIDVALGGLFKVTGPSVWEAGVALATGGRPVDRARPRPPTGGRAPVDRVVETNDGASHRRPSTAGG